MSDPAAHISAVPDIVFGIMCLMLLAALTAMLGSKLRRLPFSIALVLAGILLSRGAEIIPFLAVLSEFQLTPDLVLFVFIPTLIYESAHSLDVRIRRHPGGASLACARNYSAKLNQWVV